MELGPNAALREVLTPLLEEYGPAVADGDDGRDAPPPLSPLPLLLSTPAGLSLLSPPLLLLCWFSVPESMLGLGLRAVLRERLAGLLGLGLSTRYGLRLGFGVTFGLGVCLLGLGRLGLPLWTSKRARRGPNTARWPSLRTPLLLGVPVGGAREAFVVIRCGLVTLGDRAVARLGANTVFSATAVAAAERVPRNNAKPTHSAGDAERNEIVQPRASNANSAAHAMGPRAELWSRDMVACPVSVWVTIRARGIARAAALITSAAHTTNTKMRTKVAHFQRCHDAAAPR